ncbi:MAG: YcfL family protein [Gammaproteobacteria bacterium]|nr:YcfL family protein [Gammaproteobacteria bacterium]
MNRIELRHPLLAILAAVLLVGCNTPSGGSNPNIRHHPQNTIDDSNPRARLVLASQDLVGRIALTDARIGSAGQLTKAEVTLQNLSDDRYQLEYQFAWEDREGFSINENRVWKRITLAPRELRSVRSVAGDPKADAFTLTVRFPHDFLIEQQQQTTN